jgi:hypothetical protein
MPNGKTYEDLAEEIWETLKAEGYNPVRLARYRRFYAVARAYLLGKATEGDLCATAEQLALLDPATQTTPPDSQDAEQMIYALNQHNDG